MKTINVELEMGDLRRKITGVFKGEMRFSEFMSLHTTLRIGGPVDVMVFPDSAMALKNLLLLATKERIQTFVLGGGSNLLVGDRGIRGMAISLRSFRNVELVKETGNGEVVLFVEAGIPLGNLINYTRRYGYSGIEALSGIPGTFGGAVYCNAGSFGIEIKDVISSVVTMDREGRIRVFKGDEIGFSYRSSNLPEELMILSGCIILRRDDPEAVKMRMREFLHKKALTQPLSEPSAGCVFKNPDGYTAGRLIDEAGCKGMRVGDIEVSSVHANYFVNKGNATCKDFIRLMAQVRERVRRLSGVVLEPEIRIIGEI
jgi:UDP-N-acetylmuramate dehydrogenase